MSASETAWACASGAAWGGERCWEGEWRPARPWALWTGAALSLMHGTKETAVLAYAAMAGGLVLLLLPRYGVRGALRLVKERSNTRHLVAAFAVALGLSFVLYTSFFTPLRRPLDSLLTAGVYLRRESCGVYLDKPRRY